MLRTHTFHQRIPTVGNANAWPINLPNLPPGREWLGIAINGVSEVHRAWLLPDGKPSEQERKLVDHRRPLIGWPWDVNVTTIRALASSNLFTANAGKLVHPAPNEGIGGTATFSDVGLTGGSESRFDNFVLAIDFIHGCPGAGIWLPQQRASYELAAFASVTRTVAADEWHVATMGRATQDILLYNRAAAATVTYTIYGCLQYAPGVTPFGVRNHRTSLSTGTIAADAHVEFHGSEQWSGIEVDLNVASGTGAVEMYFRAED